MRSITRKTETLRRAVAESRLRMKPETLAKLLENDLPKKDVFAVARAAGVLAAKKTAELIPYCHPIPIDSVEITFRVESCEVAVEAAVEAVAKTGVEMEALTAASIAALTVYDMLKPVDREVEILNTKLLKKTGGKSDYMERIPPGFKAAVIVTSDSTSKGTRSDRSGRLIEERLKSFGVECAYEVIPDEGSLISAAIRGHYERGVHLIVTTGGTGLGPRDVTVEATAAVMDREIPGVMEAARCYGQRRTPYAMLSRGIAGQKGKTLIVNLPGSSQGVEESLDAVFPSLFHAYKMMRGMGHDA